MCIRDRNERCLQSTACCASLCPSGLLSCAVRWRVRRQCCVMVREQNLLSLICRQFWCWWPRTASDRAGGDGITVLVSCVMLTSAFTETPPLSACQFLSTWGLTPSSPLVQMFFMDDPLYEAQMAEEHTGHLLDRQDNKRWGQNQNRTTNHGQHTERKMRHRWLGRVLCMDHQCIPQQALGDFTFWLRLSLSLFAEPKLKLNAKVCTLTKVQLND